MAKLTPEQRLERKKEFNKNSRHHIVYKSQQDLVNELWRYKFDVHNEKNITDMKRWPHQALHILFPNMLPHEQLLYMLDLTGQVFFR